MSAQPETPSNGFLAGGGETGARLRGLNWSKTPLGPPAGWPQSLKTIVRVMLDSRYAMWMLWGPEYTFFCNDAYLPTVGLKADWVLGARADKVWEEIWPDIGPRIARVLELGQATWDEALLLFLERSGFTEETYHTFSYSPVYNDESRIAGMLCVVTEVTDKVIGERRLRVLRDLAARAIGVASLQQSCERLCEVLGQYPMDTPCAALYLAEADHQLRYMAHVGGFSADTLPFAAGRDEAPWPLQEVMRSRTARLLTGLPQLGLSIPAGPWPDAIQQALLLPLQGSGAEGPSGVLIVGLSPRRPLDEAYRSFLDLVARQTATAIADVLAFEAQRKRAEALAEIDRAKTMFFSNVSHEFRTPLTLMLGPVEESIADPRLPADARERMLLVQRNAQRLLKLVNSLLDFARIEAGRVKASFEPTDLAALTRDLCGSFRSAIEGAGLVFDVACTELPQAVYVDREMWEKIVLNLLSNALKFTLAGTIRVRLSVADEAAVLTVSDTGVGVPAHELPRLFERFHRVEGARGRSQEGSGIGLALVQELVRLHGGEITVASELAKGTTFTLRVPLGVAHLPAGHVISPRRLPGDTATAAGAPVFVQEALRWLPQGSAAVTAPLESEPPSNDRRFASTFGVRIILADDNADMRSYVKSLLSPWYRVEAVADGLQALEAARRERPALILSDVMMPNLDGMGLLESIRMERALQGIPVILLSARAGGESRVQGFDAGADDYLVKPFAARELLARVGALIELTQLRREGEERLRLAIEGARMSTWEIDLQTGVMHWSATHFEVLGYEPRLDGVASYDQWRKGLHPEDSERVQSSFSEAARTGRVYQAEYRIVRADTREVRWLSAYGRFLENQPGTVRRGVGILLDVTDRKRAEIALREADRRKDEFLATLAHELRNPLAPVRNAAKILGAERLSPTELAWCRDVIQRQVQQMSLLLDDLLDVSRVTLGRLQLRKEIVELRSIVESAVETVRPLIESRQHRFILDIPQASLPVDVDPLRLAQVLANLLTNAAKYMDPGGVIVLGARSVEHGIEVTVTDSGIGLERADLERVFMMFSQVDSALDRSQGGLGIGLALVKGLVELHGGTVRVESEGINRGCRFIVLLPGLAIRECAPTGTPATLVEPTARRRILVADDNCDAAQSLAMLFELSGHEVQTAFNGGDAIAAAESFRPHVAFIDIGMPVLNGYEVALHLRRQAWGSSIRLIALTGWGQDDNKRQAADSGFDRHVTKPVDPEILDTLLSDLKE
jgi:PAS domain S-box-containing protein